MTQTSLFEITPPAANGTNPRQAYIDNALKRAREEWKARYEAFILEYAAGATEPFTAETVRERYLSTPGVPKTDAEQASGGIFQRLVKERKLHPAGMIRSKKFGNMLQAYVKW